MRKWLGELFDLVIEKIITFGSALLFILLIVWVLDKVI